VWRIVSERVNASRPCESAKLVKVQPNIATKVKNKPLMMANGFQKFLLFQP